MKKNAIKNFDINERNYSKEFLHSIYNSWGKNAQVMNYHTDMLLNEFNPSKDDFLDSMLPFSMHPCWDSLDMDLKTKLRSCGWLLYQGNTIYIETDIVIPACANIIKVSPFYGLSSSISLSISQAMTDEGYHTLLAVRTCEEIKTQRGLSNIRPRNFHLVKEVERFIVNINSEHNKDIARIAAACCTENHITDYLELLVGKDIQPLCVKAVNAHAKDEWIHGSIFNVVAQTLYPKLDKEGKHVFKATVDHVAKHFFRADIEAWLSVFDDLNDHRLLPLYLDIKGLKDEYNKNIEFTNKNNGLKRLYEKMEWKWEKD